MALRYRPADYGIEEVTMVFIRIALMFYVHTIATNVISTRSIFLARKKILGTMLSFSE
jgi:hypothetical protein